MKDAKQVRASVESGPCLSITLFCSFSWEMWCGCFLSTSIYQDQGGENPHLFLTRVNKSMFSKTNTIHHGCHSLIDFFFKLPCNGPSSWTPVQIRRKNKQAPVCDPHNRRASKLTPTLSWVGEAQLDLPSHQDENHGPTKSHYTTDPTPSSPDRTHYCTFFAVYNCTLCTFFKSTSGTLHRLFNVNKAH